MIQFVIIFKYVLKMHITVFFLMYIQVAHHSLSFHVQVMIENVQNLDTESHEYIIHSQ